MEGCKRKREGNTCATKAASFASPPTVIGLTGLSVQRPIRIRHTLLCMTDFTRKGMKKIFILRVVRKS